jgi:hypothetical protein
MATVNAAGVVCAWRLAGVSVEPWRALAELDSVASGWVRGRGRASLKG